MVLLGGLEIVAAGYLLNEFNKDKVDERTRRRKRREDEERPHSRPPHADRPPLNQSDSLKPPQAPPRPLSAPPQQPYPGVPTFQQQQRPPPYQQNQQQIYQQRPPPSQPVLSQAQGYGSQQISSNPYLAALHNDQHQAAQPPPWQQRPAELQGLPGQLGPGHMQRPNTFGPQAQPYSQGPSPPGPGYFQQHNTFPTQPSAQKPQQSVKPPFNGPLTYIDTKTGRVSHNLYPPDHPMARGRPDGNGESTRGSWGDENYTRAYKGEFNTGMRFSERDENDLAYGKDYSADRKRRRSTSRDRARERW